MCALGEGAMCVLWEEGHVCALGGGACVCFGRRGHVCALGGGAMCVLWEEGHVCALGGGTCVCFGRRGMCVLWEEGPCVCFGRRGHVCALGGGTCVCFGRRGHVCALGGGAMCVLWEEGTLHAHFNYTGKTSRHPAKWVASRGSIRKLQEDDVIELLTQYEDDTMATRLAAPIVRSHYHPPTLSPVTHIPFTPYPQITV